MGCVFLIYNKKEEKMNVKSALPSRHHHVYEVLHNILKTVYGFVSQNTVLCIAVLAATVSSVFVKPDAEYLSYIDFKTIACLFSTLAVVCALKNIRFFTIIARKIVTTTGNLRVAAIALIYITFIGSMLIANDMALLTFLPLGFIVMQETGKDKYTAYVFILQNIAANLGGMLTPFGNPQNLYLYSKFNIPTIEFMGIMLVPFAVSILLVTLCCLFLPKEALSLSSGEVKKLPKSRTAVYIVLFFVAIATVFNIIPYVICTAVILAALAFLDRDALKILPIFNYIAKVGNIPERDMFNTFNMGVGMVVTVAKEDVEKSLQILRANGEDAYVIGEAASGDEGVIL